MKIRKLTNSQICKQNNLNKPVYSNIVDESKTKNKIRTTLKILEKVLCGTLGPYGSTTIIQDREKNHIITKDGYDLCNRIFFEDELSRTIVDLIRNIASAQVMTVGDGSTSAIVVASALYHALTDKKNYKKLKQISSKDVTSILKTLSVYLAEDMAKFARPISEDLHELETIAKISTNNDPVTGKFIYDVYKQIGIYGFITTEVTKKTVSDQADIKNGIEWKRGAIDTCFFTGYDNDKIILPEDTPVFVSNCSFSESDIPFLANVLGMYCGNKDKDLLIIANDYSEDVRNFFRNNRTKHLSVKREPELRFTAVDIDQITKTSRNTLEDLALLLGCEIYDKFKNNETELMLKPERFIGQSTEKIIVTPKTTQIITKQLDGDAAILRDKKIEALKERLSELSGIEIPNQDEDFEIFELRRRISELTNTTAVINVGGATLTERMSRERLIEDAIFACKSAIKNGYITGGNIIIPRIITKNKNIYAKRLASEYNYLPVRNVNKFMKFFLEIVKTAFLESYKNVLGNSDLSERNCGKIISRCLKEKVFYNLKMHRFENDDKTEVINSLETDIQILNSAISIIGILAVSNQVITMNFDLD